MNGTLDGGWEKGGEIGERSYVCAKKRRHGRLGQQKHFGTGALAITRATKAVMERAVTSLAALPPCGGEEPETEFNQETGH